MIDCIEYTLQQPLKGKGIWCRKPCDASLALCITENTWITTHELKGREGRVSLIG